VSVCEHAIFFFKRHINIAFLSTFIFTATDLLTRGLILGPAVLKV
jgi:hypothetical protein